MHRIIVALAVVSVAACGGADASESPARKDVMVTSAATATLVSPLAGRRVYFAHQSVGSNIVTGLEKLLLEQPALGLRTVATREPSVLAAGPAFVHFLAGRNGDPASKNADFLKLLDKRTAPDNGIALLKYCYADASAPQTAEEIFAAYQNTVAAVRSRHPDLTLVHVTMPLRTIPTGPRALMKRVLGQEPEREEAIKRHRFNTLMRSSYASSESLFDIADLESRREDGSRAFFVAGKDTIPTLAADYTWDGGHLNERAQRIAAQRLLEVLSRAAGVR